MEKYCQFYCQKEGRLKVFLTRTGKLSAEGGSRTHNPVKEQRPERCVYASFTTSALACQIRRIVPDAKGVWGHFGIFFTI